MITHRLKSLLLTLLLFCFSLGIHLVRAEVAVSQASGMELATEARSLLINKLLKLSQIYRLEFISNTVIFSSKNKTQLTWRSRSACRRQTAAYKKVIQAQTEESKTEKSANLYAKLANAMVKQKSFEEAINYYQQEIALKPDNEKLYFALGNTYSKQEQFNEAIGNYQKAIAIQNLFHIKKTI